MHVITKKEALTDWPGNQVEFSRKTPASAIAWAENLSARCCAEAHRIAKTSTVEDGDTWSENGIHHMAAHIANASMYLWKSSLFAGAGNGCEVFDDTDFDIEVPLNGMLFVADKTLTAKLRRDEEQFDALLLQPTELKNGNIMYEGKEIPWLRKPKNPGQQRHDGRYVSGIMFNFFPGLHGEIGLRVKAIPLFRIGDQCHGWASLLKALFMFMDQKIVSVERYGPPRSERRRLQKLRMPIWDVKVISLRRYAKSGVQSDEPHPVDWQCQWTVSAHWRKQPYANGVVKPIWIEPFIKGPDDKPLKDPTKSIFSVRR